MSFWVPLVTMLVGLVNYHVLEFLAVSYIKGGFPRTWAGIYDRLLISPEYLAALGVGLLEYLLEYWLAPSLKDNSFTHVLYWVGLLMVILGDGLRKCAILYNKRGFDHYIQYEKLSGQKLITTGPYAISRHPAYCGWFYMTLGFMVLLANPISFVIYWAWSYMFFKERIIEEEEALCKMFPDYPEYIKHTPVRIPGLK